VLRFSCCAWLGIIGGGCDCNVLKADPAEVLRLKVLRTRGSVFGVLLDLDEVVEGNEAARLEGV